MSSEQQKQQQSMHYATTYYESPLVSNTTFVQADPSNFRAIVQHFTGSQSQGGGGGDQQTASYKLHERRQGHHAIRKLEMINLTNNTSNSIIDYHHHHHGPVRPRGGSELPMASPVSPLDGLGLGIGTASPSRARGRSSLGEEGRVVIAEKGFYLHPPVSNLNNGAHFNNNVRDNEPQLLPLFPIHSPRDDQN